VIKLLSSWLLLLSLTVNSLASVGQGIGEAPAADDPLRLLQDLDEYPHAERVDFSDDQVIDHEVALGSINKFRGVWQFRDSERLSGRLVRYTWQIVDGFSSSEVMQELVDKVLQNDTAELLFACEGRACGKSAQWANRVFLQRILYGREDLQAYSVYRLGEAGRDRMVLYSAARTADRQYLHVELLIGTEAD
jgi:hypothetical protein